MRTPVPFDSSLQAPSQVAEILGLYGPISISELLVQKIWLRQDLRGGELRTTDGRVLKIIRPGRWNRLEGPDFLGAELELEGRRVLGDVEIHFYQRDWRAHRHDENPGFDGVVLHVVVFDPGEGECPAVTAAGRSLPTLVLAPLLKEGLEDYAIRDALRALEQADPLELAAPLLTMPLDQRRERLRAAASLRWHQKCHFARKRLEAAGSWEGACHQALLEVLGYRRNRAPMGDLALRHPLRSWIGAGVEWTERLFAEEREAWRLRGSRPANHPRQRLRQYARLVEQCPDWPARVERALRTLAPIDDGAGSTQAFRRRTRTGEVRRAVLQSAWAGVIPSPRADTILIDGILPLAAEHLGREDLYAHWLHWWPGDLPDVLKDFLRTIRVVTRPWPLSNGLQQAALQILIER